MIRIITVLIKQAKYEADLYERIDKGLTMVGVEVIAVDGFQLSKSTIQIIEKEVKQ